MGLGRQKVKIGLGIAISTFFMYLAVRKVDLNEMWETCKDANYWYVMLAITTYFVSLFLRAVRWRYLLEPIKRLDLRSLLSSLIIGYMANVLLPLHLGEILRAYILSKKREISASSVFATIVVERIIDVFTLIACMVLAILIHPVPRWVRDSTYILLVGSLGLFFFLILLRRTQSHTLAIFRIALAAFPSHFQQEASVALEKFKCGVAPLKTWVDYCIVSLLSLAIWACYGLIFYLGLQAFHFVRTFDLPWSASLILLVVTTIAIIIPSSPGYVGTYHYLCQVSLSMFGVSPSAALSFATLVHGVNFLPVLLVGLILSYYEGVGIFTKREKRGLKSGFPEIA